MYFIFTIQINLICLAVSDLKLYLKIWILVSPILKHFFLWFLKKYQLLEGEWFEGRGEMNEKMSWGERRQSKEGGIIMSGGLSTILLNIK